MGLDQQANATTVLEVGDELLPDPSPDQQQTPPSPRRPLFSGLGFSRETAEELLPPSLEPNDAGSDSDDEWPSLDESPRETGQPASSADAPALVSKAQLKETFRAGVAISSTTAHKLGARTPGQQYVGLYLADDADCRGIGDPLAEIAHRRGGLAGGQMSPDANNLLQAVMAIAGYIAKQVRGVQDARVVDQRMRSGVQPTPEDVAA